jgi:hypothetical protein
MQLIVLIGIIIILIDITTWLYSYECVQILLMAILLIKFTIHLPSTTSVSSVFFVIE